jgi:hypothetical protein
VNDDRRIQRVNRIFQFAPDRQIGARQQCRQPVEVGSVAIERGRVQRDDVVAFLDRGKPGIDVAALGRQVLSSHHRSIARTRLPQSSARADDTSAQPRLTKPQYIRSLPKAANIRRGHCNSQLLQINGQRSGVRSPLIVRHGSLRHASMFDNL